MATRLPIARDSEAKLRYILRHAAQIFAERGFQGASIRDISRATGMSLSGLYYYIESKQKLLYLIQHHAFTSILRQLQGRLAGARDPEKRLKIFIQNHVEYFLTHPAEMKVLSHEDDALQGRYRREVAAIKRRYYNLAREIFDGLAQRVPASDLNPRIAVLSLYGMMNWVYKWHNAKVDPRAEELAAAMAEIFLHGVLRDANPSEDKQNLESAALEKIRATG